jgi:phage repressor protein C with HTH and peptisase S24 domain
MKTETTFAERLNLAMKEAGLSQGALAKASGLAQPTIWRLANGKGTGSSKVIDIAMALNVSPEWLASGKGQMRIDLKDYHDPRSETPPVAEWKPVSAWDSHTELDDDEVEVPFLKDIEFACGDGSVSEEDYNGYKIRFSKATLRRIGARTDGTGILCFPARGDSMEPRIFDGATVAVNIDDKKISDGKIYAINENGWKRIKMLYQVGPDTVSIRSYNKSDYPDETRKMSEVEVIGRVFWTSELL